ncbi:MAG TPA: glycoside hydrolase family 15 protein [Chloroflexia bacterium]|nr:glycoside hydrolase family 15 protein [Chloroflexia bacterium]
MTDLLIKPEEAGAPGKTGAETGADRYRLRQLALKSIEIIKAGQAPGGAIVACPNFTVYRYCWLRDGSFCAHALALTGSKEEAAAFHRWVGRVLENHREKAEAVLRRHKQAEKLTDGDFLNTRYTLEGLEEAPHADGEEWWNFQLDGYGTWLWALGEYLTRHPDAALRQELAGPVELTVQYLSAFWKLPNFDCWEENRHDIHPATLAAIYGGLRAAARLYPESAICAAGNRQASALATFVKKAGIYNGSLVKSLGRSDVDASLLGAFEPYNLFPLRGQVARSTLARIENELVAQDGGVYRYRKDVYFGGGEWLLLTGWLGWYYVRSGQRDKARACLKWMVKQAGDDGQLPEQVSHFLLAPEHLPVWETRWGKSAMPLLWSHAMYLILYIALYGEDNI